MAKQEIQTNRPTAIIVHGANFLGKKLAELLTTQKTNILVLDEFTKSTRETLSELKNKYSAKVYDLSGIQSLTETLKRVDYVFILLDQYLITNSKITSKKFLSETNILDATFKLALEHAAKVALTTTISLHRKISSSSSPSVDKLSDVPSQNPYNPTELQKYCENLAAEYHDQTALNIRICRLGEVMGEEMPLETSTTLVNMIKEAITKPRITIPGEGLDYTYYIHVLDAVYGLIKATFSNKTNGEVFSLSYPEEISTLNLAYRILEMNPKAGEIEFSESEDSAIPQQVYVPAKNLNKIGWNTRITFEKALLETMEYFHNKYNVKWKDKPQEQLEKPKQPTPKKPAKKPRSEQVTPFGKFINSITNPIQKGIKGIFSKFKRLKNVKLTPSMFLKYSLISAVAIVIYIFLLAPLIQIIAGGLFTYYFGKKGYQQAYNLETEDAQKSLDKASYFASLTNTGVTRLSWLSYIPGVDNLYEESAELAEGVDHLGKAGSLIIEGFDPYANYFKNFEPITSFDENAGGGSRTYVKELEEMEDGIPYIENGIIEISLASESLENVDTTVFPSFIRSDLRELIKNTKKIDENTETIGNIATFLPEILGKDGRKTYVVLFQNPMELRSTGGWLTSYALIGIEHGQVRTMTVDDAYNVDGQIKQHVDPPISMEQALDVSNWKFTLSNWSPNFPQSAEAAEYFLTLTDKVVEVDGVIAIDLEYVRDLIDVWGEIEVPGEDEPVTKDDLYDKVIEIHREFTPGSREKPVFLSNLSNEITKKLLSDGKDKWVDIVSITSENLEENHIQIYHHNTNLNDMLVEEGWSGQLTPLTNIVYPVEWNWGGNKANYYISRSTTITSNITSEDSIQQKLTIYYENTSQKNTYPEGDYENYIRIYLPENSQLLRVEGIDNYKVTSEEGVALDVLSGWVTVPIKSNRTISVSYKLERNSVKNFPITIESDGKIKYSLNFIKQAGLDEDSLTIEVTYPDSWEPQDLTDIQREINTLIRRTNLKTDQEFSLIWER